jgi:hypothetical protein
MENKNDSDAKLVIFLRNLADSIDKKELVPRQLHSISEFFMKYQFQQQAILANDDSLPKTNQTGRYELCKFIVFGWYVYCCILTKDSILLHDDDEDLIMKKIPSVDAIAPVD